MKLRSFQARQLRRFTDGIRIDHFEPGINVFHGPNGSGKSSIIRAIRAAFYDRYQTAKATDLRPRTDPGAAPSVQVQFDHAGVTYHLSKRFLKSANALLVSAQGRLENAHADDYLADLLGFTHPSSGLTPAKHLGIPGLLWIEQGEGQDIKEPAGFAQTYLRDALGQSIGDLTSSDADHVLQELTQQRNQILSTDKKRKPIGDYNKALKAKSELAKLIALATERADRYRETVDQLALVQEQINKHNRSKPWLAFESQIQEKQTVLTELKTIQARHESLRSEQQQLSAQIALHEATIRSDREHKQQLEQRIQALSVAQVAYKEAETTASHAREQRVQSRQVLANAQVQFKQFELSRRRLQLQEQQQRIKNEISRLEQQYSQAKVSEQKVRQLTRGLGDTPLTASQVSEVRDLEREQQLLQARLDAAATSLQWNLKPEAQLSIDQDQLSGQGERLITGSTELSLGKLGNIRIVPGGQGASELAESLATVTARLTRRLETLNATSGSVLESMLLTTDRCKQDLKLAQEQLKIHAPDGVAVLDAAISNQRDQVNQVSETLESIRPAGAIAQDISGTEDELSNALEAAREADERTEKIQGQADNERISALAVQTSAQKEHNAAAALINSPDFDSRSLRASEQIAIATARLAGLNSEIEQVAAKVARADPANLTLDIERLTRSAESARGGHTENQSLRRELQARLDEASANGTGEKLAELNAKYQRLERQTDWFERRANALCLLTDRLEAARAQATELLQAPLQKHLNRYLNALMPGANLRLADSLVPDQLNPNGALTDVGRFDSQSFGTREQLSLLTRLAYADLLREAGRPTLIILDDGLVHSDNQRLAQMKRILYQASTRHQILIFTCHDDRWDDLGVAPVDIRSLPVAQIPGQTSASAA